MLAFTLFAVRSIVTEQIVSFVFFVFFGPVIGDNNKLQRNGAEVVA